MTDQLMQCTGQPELDVQSKIYKKRFCFAQCVYSQTLYAKSTLSLSRFHLFIPQVAFLKLALVLCLTLCFGEKALNI